MNIEEQLTTISERETDMHFNNVGVNPEIIPKESIEENLPYLERELTLFPNVRVIMLIGGCGKESL